MYLTFQQIDHVDFRVYKVKDAIAFFAGLRDPHVLGGPEPVVPQEQTWLERIAAWKAARRAGIRGFLRRQVSAAYRARRRESAEREQIVRRRTVGYARFAQVPLLNPARVVATWRELLPRVRDAEARRVPLELPGSGVYLVEAVFGHLRAHTIVIVSDLGLLTKTAPGQMLSFAAHRDTGEPVSGCRVVALADRQRAAEGETGADGTFLASLGVERADALVTVAVCGSEAIATDPGAWSLRAPALDLVGYVYTDRPIYRPGHTAHVRAILRWRERGVLRSFDRPEAELVVVDSADQVVLRETRPVDAFGSLSGSIVISPSAALGYYTVQINVGDRQASGSFEVQEYRKPEFEVAVSAPRRFVLQGEPAQVTIRARYYFGQPVSGAQVTYVVYRAPYYSPWRWIDADVPSEYQADGYRGEQISESTTALDGRGEAIVTIPVAADEQSRDVALRVEARVSDASAREVAAATTLVGTQGRFLLAAALDQYMFAPGAGARLRVRAVDYDGTPHPNVPIAVTLERLTYPDGRYDRPTREQVARGSVTTDPEGRAEWALTVPREAGDYRVTVSSVSAGRTVSAEVGLWVPGGTETPYDAVERTFELVFDKRTYAPGDTVRVRIRGEAYVGAVLVTKERELTSFHRVVRVASGGVIELPVSADDVGDTWVNVAFLKDGRLYRAEKRLSVPADSERLQVSVTPARAVSRPRDPEVITVRTLDAAGRPVRAQVSVAVVDEAIFGVRPDTTPDPVRFFHHRAYSRVTTQFSRDYGFVGYSGTERLQLAQRRRPFTLADFKGEPPERLPVRREFPDAILWVADLDTGPGGTTSVRVAYPDALTTWRVTARAVTTGSAAGSAVTRTTVTKDLILRIVPPRFLTEGDLVRVPVIVNNYLTGARTVELSVGATGLEALDASPREPARVEAQAGGEAALSLGFRASAPGTATLTGTARTTDDADAMAVSFPVLPFGTRRERGASGSIAGAGETAAAIAIPEASNPAARGMRVELSPSLAGSLLGALDFLAEYPYGCTEQTLSSFLPNLLVTRALAELKLAPTERMRALDRMAADGLERLFDYQHEGGGWGWWKSDRDHPFMTAYALYGLLEAGAAGLQVDRGRVTRAASSTARLYVEYARAVPDLKAYMGWVLALAAARGTIVGDVRGWNLGSALDELLSARDRMSDYGRALTVLALDAGRDSRSVDASRDLLGRAQQKGGLAWWTSERDPLLDDFSDSSVEATAFAVMALASRHAGDPRLEQAVRWLMANRGGGAHWGSTKQTAMALYGLLAYLRARDERPETFAVEVFVNGESRGTRTLTPEDWVRPRPVTIEAPAVAGRNEIRLVKQAGGRLYWSATARYYDTRESSGPSGSHTLAVTRRYFTLSPVHVDGRIVYRETPLAGSISPGDLLLVRLSAAGSTAWQFLVLEDPIPAGTEAVTAPEAYALERPVTWWWGSQREYRDDRVVIFQERFDRGRYDYAYLLRVVTAGEYRAMPARLSPMYMPDVGATSASHQVSVEAPSTGTPTLSAPGARP